MSTKKSNVFFHTGPNGDGANMTGIGDAMRELHNAGIPVFLKSADNYGPLYELDKLIDPNETVDHVLVFRISDKDEYTYDTPPYKDPLYANDPEGGAIRHWNMTKTRIPPEFNKSRVWLELTNEVDRNLCEWLGRFAIKIADLAETEGYKVLLFGWASGEPEPVGWEEPSMLQYLRTCAEKPHQRGISLHEYSYIVTNILDGFPFKLGRFQYLFATCDKHNINRPTTAITEWGWTLDDVPSPENAIPDVEVGARLYAPYNNILGAAIWYLGPGFKQIGNKTQKLIAPVTAWTKTTDIEYNQDPEIAPLEEIGGWKQYGEIMPQIKTISSTVFGRVAGFSDKRITKLRYQYEYNTGSGANVFTQEYDIPVPSGIDLRGLSFRAYYEQDIEFDCGGSMLINDNDTGVDVSYWNQ